MKERRLKRDLVIHREAAHRPTNQMRDVSISC